MQHNFETTPTPETTEQRRIEELIRDEQFWIEDQLQRLTKRDSGLSVNDKRNLFDQIKYTILHHMIAKEKAYYQQIPELLGRQSEQTYQMVLSEVRKCQQEHHQAKTLMNELEDLAVENPDWSAKLRVLLEDLQQHHKEIEKKFLHLTEARIDKGMGGQLAAQYRKAKNKVII